MKPIKLLIFFLIIISLSGCATYRPPQHENVAYLLFFGGNTKYSIASLPEMKWRAMNVSFIDSFTLGLKYHVAKIDAAKYQTLKGYYYFDSGVRTSYCENDLQYAFKPEINAVYFTIMLQGSACRINVFKTEMTPEELQQVVEKKLNVGKKKNILDIPDADLKKFNRK